jgi:hypothetical protein
MAFFGHARGHRVKRGLAAINASGPTASWILTLDLSVPEVDPNIAVPWSSGNG